MIIVWYIYIYISISINIMLICMVTEMIDPHLIGGRLEVLWPSVTCYSPAVSLC